MTTVMGVVGGDASLADPDGEGGLSGDFAATSVFGEAGGGHCWEPRVS